MSNNISANNLQISRVLYDFIEKEATPGSGITADQFWDSLAALIAEFGPKKQGLTE